MRGQSGFTLIELLVAMSMSVVLMLVITNFMVNTYRTGQQEQTKTEILNNTKLAVETVAKAVKSAKSVESANSQPDDNSPGAPANLYSWAASAGSGATLILAVPARDTSNNLIYSDGLHNNLYTNDYVYYLDPATRRLYRRIIANQSAPGNAAKTTCPPSKATPACPSDALTVEDVANLTTSYFDANNASVSSPTGTEAVQITLTQTRSIVGKSYSSSYTTIATLRNK
jgi:prepilin-type N-terminal cleavage/methylation domain-containing protein